MEVKPSAVRLLCSVFFILFFFASIPCLGQTPLTTTESSTPRAPEVSAEAPGPKQETGPPEAVENGGILDVPCRFIRGHIFVLAQAGGHERFWLVDSGAEISMIDNRLKDELKLETKDIYEVRGAYKTTECPLVTLDKLHIDNVIIHNLHLLSADLEPLFKKSCRGIHFGGVLGKDFLQKFITKIDFAKERLSFYTPETFKYKGNGEVLKADLIDGFLSVPVTVDGNSGNWIVDIGAGNCSFHFHYAWTRGFTKRSGIRYTCKGLGGSAEGCISMFGNLELGSFTLHRPIVSFPVRQTWGAFGDEHIDGNLGNSVLSHFVVYLDFIEPRMILEKGTSFDNGFPLRVAGGMDLVVTEDGGVRVHHLDPRAAWKKAGLCKGDILSYLQGMELAGFDGLVVLAEELKRRPSKYEFTVSREGQSFDLMCRIKKRRRVRPTP